jgi:hypothetical protein
VRFSGQAAQLGRPSVVKDVSTRLVDEFAQCIGEQLSRRPVTNEATSASDQPKPLSGLALVWVAVRGAAARLFGFRSGLREKGSR